MVKVTVVIPNYNGIKYIADCIQSLYEQNNQQEFAIIVVDNGSTDGSYELVRDTFPEVKTIRLDTNTGFSHAVNVGIKAADTPYIILLNNDTLVQKDFIQNLVTAIEKDENIFSVSAQMIQWNQPNLLDDAGDQYCVLGWAYARGKGQQIEEYSKSVRIFSACAGAAIYRKAVFQKIGYFDELHFAYLEDVDIGYRGRIYGYENRYEPTAKVFHIGSASSGSRYNEFKTKLVSANSVYVIGKNMPLLQWIWNLPFLILGFAIKFLYFTLKKMGMLYLKGLWNGLKRCGGKEGRKNKIPFQLQNIKHYVIIQWELYRNTIGLFLKK